MPTIFKYQFIYHPSFHEGLIYSVNSREGFADVFFFESRASKQLLLDFIKEKCHSLVSPMKLKDVIDRSLINYIFDPWTQDKGKRYVSDTRIKILHHDEYKVVAMVLGTHQYQVTIKSNVDELAFDCSCPVAEQECKHAFALMKYLSNMYCDDEVMKKTPFEEMFYQMSNTSTRKFFDLGFELENLFFEKEETNIRSIYQFLNGYDYYSNRSFIPLVLNKKIFKILLDSATYDIRLKLNKIQQRYQRAIEGRSTSLEDILFSLIFLKRYEDIFAYKFYSSYLSPLGLEGIIYASLRSNLTLEMVEQLGRLSIKDEDIIAIFSHASDKAVKKYLYLKYRHLFNNLSEEEIKGLEYSVEEIYDLFLHSSPSSLSQIVISHYQRFIDEKKEEYLPMMVKNAIDNLSYRSNNYLELYKVIESLSDNSLLLKIDFKATLQEADDILNRWRGYDDNI